MAMLTSFFSVLTLQVLVWGTSAKDLQIEVHPSEISLGISSSLDINCSFSVMDHPEMAAFVSLILSKANSSGQNFDELAAITQFSPHSVTVLTQEKVSAAGVHSQTGESFMQLVWEYPTATQAGVYQCVAHGLDTLGHPLEVVNISTVTVEKANLNDIFEKLKQMEIHETAMENKMSEMEKHIEALEYNNSLQNSYITDLEDTVASLRRMVGLNLLGTYQNHDYYISNVPYGKINVAITVCNSHGGYLTEIDNQNELNAMKSFLNLTSGFGIAMIAGTDEAVDGTWILQSNHQPLPFTSWYTSGASTGRGTDCLGLVRSRSWNMDDYSCNIDPPDNYFRFTCEIPRV